MSDELKGSDRIRALQQVFAKLMDEMRTREEPADVADRLMKLADLANWAWPESQQAALKEAVRLAQSEEYKDNPEAQLKIMTGALQAALNATAKNTDFVNDPEKIKNLQSMISLWTENRDLEIDDRKAHTEKLVQAEAFEFEQKARKQKEDEAKRAEFDKKGTEAVTVPEREGHKASANSIHAAYLPDIEVGKDGQASLKGTFTKEQAEAITWELNNPRGSITFGQAVQDLMVSPGYAKVERVEGTDQYRVKLNRDAPGFTEQANLPVATWMADKFTDENADKAAALVQDTLGKIKGFEHLLVTHKRNSMQAEIYVGSDAEGEYGTDKNGKDLSATDRAGEALAAKIGGRYDKEKHVVIVEDISKVADKLDIRKPNIVGEVINSVGEARKKEMAAIEKEKAVQQFIADGHMWLSEQGTRERAELLADLHAPPQPRAVASTPTSAVPDNELVTEFEKVAARFVDLSAQRSHQTLTADERAEKIQQHVDRFRSLNTTYQRNKLEEMKGLNKYIEADIKYPRLEEEKAYKEAVEKWVAAEHKLNPKVDVKKVTEELLRRGTSLDSEGLHNETLRLTRLTEAAEARQKAKEARDVADSARSNMRTFCEQAGIQSHLKWEKPGEYMVQMPDYALVGDVKDKDAVARRQVFVDKLNSLIPESKRDAGKPLARIEGALVIIDAGQLAKVDPSKLEEDFKKERGVIEAEAAKPTPAQRLAIAERELAESRARRSAENAEHERKMAARSIELGNAVNQFVATSFDMEADKVKVYDKDHSGSLDDEEKLALLRDNKSLQDSLYAARKRGVTIDQVPEIALLKTLESEAEARAAEAPSPAKVQDPPPGLPPGTSTRQVTGAAQGQPGERETANARVTGTAQAARAQSGGLVQTGPAVQVNQNDVGGSRPAGPAPAPRPQVGTGR